MKRITLFPFFFTAIILLFSPYILIQICGVFFLMTISISFLYAKINMRSLSITRPNPIYRFNFNQKANIPILLKNRGFLPIEAVAISDSASCFQPGSGKFIESITSFNKKKITSSIYAKKRGSHKVGPITTQGSDPLALFPWKKVFQSFCEVIIYPAFFPLNILLKEGVPEGNIKINNLIYEDRSKLKTMRDYQPGDSLKKINWKASAKSANLQTMEYSSTLNTSVLVALDLDLNNYRVKNQYQDIERTISTAASIIVEYLTKKQQTSLISNGLFNSLNLYIPLQNGNRHLISILEKLALLKPSTEKCDDIYSLILKHTKSVLPGSHIYIITPHIQKNITLKLELFKRNKCIINIIYCGKDTQNAQKLIPDFCKFYTLSNTIKDLFNEEKRK